MHTTQRPKVRRPQPLESYRNGLKDIVQQIFSAPHAIIDGQISWQEPLGEKKVVCNDLKYIDNQFLVNCCIALFYNAASSC